MGLSRRVLLLWSVRIFVLLTLLFPVSDYTGVKRSWCVLIFLLIFLFAFLIFYFRYRACLIKATAEGIKISAGIIIRRTLYVKYRHVVSANRIYTPLSQHLGLSNLIIYCEGAAFLLPPLTNPLIKVIEESIKSEVTNNEA